MYLVSNRNDVDARTRPQLRVLLFGEALVTYTEEGFDDVPIPSRCMLLLAYLMLHPKTRSRERIAAALWPDVRDSEARANLRRILHELVRVLPPGPEPWIVIDSQRIYWNPRAPLWCDVETFDRLADDDRTRAAAVDVYTGDLLAGEDADWIEADRSALRERQLEALGLLADACLARGDLAGAASAYRRLLDIDPFREDAFRSLLAVRLARGDRARAVSEYICFAVKLSAELGVEPMPETVACYQRILRGTSPDHVIEHGFATNESTTLRSTRRNRHDVRNFVGARAT